MRRAAIVFSIALVAALPAHANWVASGTFLYQDREWNETGFTGTITSRPMRFADVEIHDPNKSGSKRVLAKGKTDANGAFSISVVDSSTRTVRAVVFARTVQTTDLFVKVTNPSGSVWAGNSQDVPNHNPNTNTNFGTLTALAFAGAEAFNIFDLAIYGADYIKAMTGTRPNSSKLVTLKWASNGGVSASSVSGNTVTLRDSAGFDDTVILHEWSHYAMNNYSKSSNPTGTHALADCFQDARLAFDEGRATYLGNAVLRHFNLGRPAVYVRTSGASGPGGATNWFDLETETQYDCDGSTSEVTVARSLWDIGDSAATPDFTPGVEEAHDLLSLPDTEVWDVFAGPVKSATTVTHESFWNGWFDASIANGFKTEMIGIFSYLSIEYFPDPFESNESSSQAPPIVPNAAAIHLTYFADPDGDGKGQADTDVFRFDAVSGTPYTIETFGLFSDADTILELLDTNGSTVLASNDNRATGDRSSLIQWTAPRSDVFYVRSKRASGHGIHGSYDLRLTSSP